MVTSQEESPLPGPPVTLRLTLYVVLVVALVSLPFVLFGEEFAFPLLETPGARRWALIAISVALLSADAIAPIPSVIVIVGLAVKAGWLAGIIGGTVGLTGQVFFAGLFGRYALGPVAPRFFPQAELSRVRSMLHDRLALTLACLRSVPVLAEVSVVVAASVGVPLRRIMVVTLVPNVAIASIYSMAVDASFLTAVIAFFATVVPSYIIWRAMTGDKR